VLARAVLGVLAIGFPTVVFVKIARQRRAIGKSPVILGKAGGLQGMFERLSPFALLFWPAAFLWAAAGRLPLAEGPRCALGLALMIGGGLVSGSSVFLMGRAWRIGLDPDNRTDLAENGPYRWIRHPIYSGWLLILIGSVLVIRDSTVDVAAAVTALGVLAQAMREEQHMLKTFGERYARYAAHTGRFAPRVPWRTRSDGGP
jgi:protein-S-isoprenylcysteine O-methyltransferase Ste14